MDYAEYQKRYFVEPAPPQRFAFAGSFGMTLYYQDYQAAVAFYTSVLGPPGYIEGSDTHGWRIGGGWLTLLAGRDGNPKNVEVTFAFATPAEAERFQRACLDAGAAGEPPSDQLMYLPVRCCPVVDPLGVDVMIFAPLPHD